MVPLHIAPCGIICNICLGFQRTKNTCEGCISTGNKRPRCETCSFKTCPEKRSNPHIFCYECKKFPCQRLKRLEKRYTIRYGESPIQNLLTIREIGMESFSMQEKEKWTCIHCGNINELFPDIK